MFSRLLPPRPIAIAAVSVPFLAVLGSELAIPPLAERKVRDHARDIAEVRSVDVDVSPAVKALWGDIDGVDVRLGPGTIDPSELHEDDVLDRLRDLPRAHASAESLRIGAITADNVDLMKTGDRLDLRFSVSLETLQTSLPGAQISAKGAADGVTLHVSTPQLPIPGGLRLRLGVQDGALVAQGQGQAAALLGSQELFAPKTLGLERLSSSVDGDRLDIEVRAGMGRVKR